MDFSSILNLVIGLIFIYFLVGLFCSTIQEMIVNFYGMRSANLNKWIRDTFKENGLGDKILSHKLIDGLTAEGRSASYIPSSIFADTILDLINKSGSLVYSMDTLKASIADAELPEDLKRRLAQSISEADGSLNKVRGDLESWFNHSMERISGTYKKFTQFYIFCISLAVVCILNIDSIQIIQYLYDHPAKAAALADQVTDYVETENMDSVQVADTPVDSLSLEAKIQGNLDELKRLKSEIGNTSIPLGWQKSNGGLNFRVFLNKIFGLAMTVIAGIIGAPFWFDMLNKLVNLRSSGLNPENKKPKN